MNANKDHLEDDINRLIHTNSYVEHKYIIHLYRISGPNPKVSNRDFSPRSKKILASDQIFKLIKVPNIKIYFGVADITKIHECGLWLIDKEGIAKINE